MSSTLPTVRKEHLDYSTGASLVNAISGLGGRWLSYKIGPANVRRAASKGEFEKYRGYTVRLPSHHARTNRRKRPLSTVPAVIDLYGVKLAEQEDLKN